VIVSKSAAIRVFPGSIVSLEETLLRRLSVTSRRMPLVGRARPQVKIRGFRIELGEIEAAVHAVSGVQDAAVVAVDSPATDGPVICCAFVAAPLWEFSPLALKREVSRLLPHYVIPRMGCPSRTCRVTRTEKRTACGSSSGSFATAKPAPFRETRGSVPLRAVLDKRIFNAR
jgi:AMP-binding enzyme C-terminal domain